MNDDLSCYLESLETYSITTLNTKPPFCFLKDTYPNMEEPPSYKDPNSFVWDKQDLTEVRIFH